MSTIVENRKPSATGDGIRKQLPNYDEHGKPSPLGYEDSSPPCSGSYTKSISNR